MARDEPTHEAHAEELRTCRLFVGWASAIGIFLVAVVAIAGEGDNPVRATAIFLGYGLPFLVALASLMIPLEHRARRWLWLVCAIGALVPSFFFLWNGTGFFLFAIAVTYLWAFWISRTQA